MRALPGRRAAIGLLLGAGLAAARPVRAASPYLEELTSPELRQRIDAGATTALVPIGGTEQNGAHLLLGKHNQRARVLAGLIAQRLGEAVVAPVLAYVPEGGIEPPTGHMRWAGTISVPDAAFEAVLEGTAASLRRHGFRESVVLGEHGGYQPQMARVAARLDAAWRAPPRCRVWALAEYYRAAQQGFGELLAARGFTADEIGSHAGLADTALALAVDAALVRAEAQARGASDGVRGDPRRASAELGRLGVAHIVERSVAAILERRRQR